MAVLNKSQLKTESNNTYIDNNAGLIVPSNIRNLNTDIVDSMALQTDLNSLSSSFIAVSQSVANLSGSSFDSSSFVKNSQTASMTVASASYSAYALTASYALNGGSGGGSTNTSSLATTASLNAYTASNNAIRATTGSNNFVGNQDIDGTVTATSGAIGFLQVNFISASQLYTSGNTKFGDDATDKHQFTGSVSIQGPLTVEGLTLTSGSFSGSLNGTASFAVSASQAVSSSYSVSASSVNLDKESISMQKQTGILTGGVLTAGAGNNKFNVSAGSGLVISQSVLNGKIITTETYCDWAANTNVDIDDSSAEVAFVYIDALGDVYQQTSSFTESDTRTKIILGAITHTDGTLIDSLENMQNTSYGAGYKADSLINILGVLKVDGLQIKPVVGTLGFGINSGSVYNNGVNFGSSPILSPYQRNVAEQSQVNITRVANKTTGYTFDNNGGTFYTAIDPTKYVSGSTLEDVTSGYYTIQRVYQHPDNPGNVFVYYGNSQYATRTIAVNSIVSENFEEATATKANATFIGWIIAKSTATDLSSTSEASITYAGKARGYYPEGTNITADFTSQGETFAFLIPATTWSINHNLGFQYPMITLFESGSNEIIFPDKTVATDDYQTNVYFNYARTGYATVAAAGAIINATASVAVTTASYAQNSLSSSYATTASYLEGGIASSSWASSSLSSSYSNKAISASFAVSSSLARSSSYAKTSEETVNAAYPSVTTFLNGDFGVLLSSTSSTGYQQIGYSFGSKLRYNPIVDKLTVGAISASLGVTGSLLGTASYATQALSSSYGIAALTASYLSGSSAIVQNIEVLGTASIKYLNVSYETASVIYSTGSNKFGDAANDVHEFTGSVGMSGSLLVVGPATINNLTGSLLGTAATASYVNTLNQTLIVSGAVFISGSTVQEGNNTLKGNTVLSGSIRVSGSTVFNNSEVIISGSQFFTGSAYLTGSQNILGAVNVRATANAPLVIDHIDGDSVYIGYSSEGDSKWLTGNQSGSNDFIVYNPQTFTVPVRVKQSSQVDFYAGVSASSFAGAFTGSLLGTATQALTASYLLGTIATASSANTVLVNEGNYNSNSAFKLLFATGTNGRLDVYQSDKVSVNGLTGLITAAGISASEWYGVTTSSFAHTASYVSGSNVKGAVATASVANSIFSTDGVGGSGTWRIAGVGIAGGVANIVSTSSMTYYASNNTLLFEGGIITASRFQGTASYAMNALTASYIPGGATTTSASFAQTASYVQMAQSASASNMIKVSNPLFNEGYFTFVENSVAGTYQPYGMVGMVWKANTKTLSISGSIAIATGSIAITSGSISLGNGSFTGSLTGSVNGTLNGASIDNTAWTSFTPDWQASSTNPSIGNGTITGAYKIIGKTCFYRGRIKFGTTTTAGNGAWYIGLPVTASSAYGIHFAASILDDGNAWYSAQFNGARAGFAYKSEVQYQGTGGTAAGIGSTVPFSWGSSDEISWNGTFEVA